MAGTASLSNCKILTSLKVPFSATRHFHSSPALCLLHIRAGRYKNSRNQTVKLTYEQAKPSYLLGVEKSWNTWNTTNLRYEGRRAETLAEDAFIRMFMAGTFPMYLVGDVIIKRRHNMIILPCILKMRADNERFHFLVGFTEELLSMLLKCIVKMEVQFVPANDLLIFKRI